MSFPLSCRALALLAAVVGLLLAAGTTQAQTKPAGASDETSANRAKRAQPTPAPTASSHHRIGKGPARGESDQSEMIMLQEPFRSGAAVPVNMTHGGR